MKQLLCSLLAGLLLASCSGKNARDLYADARAAQDSGDVFLALEKFEELVRDYPTEAVAETAMYRIVMLRSGTPGDKAPAVEAQTRFLRLYPNSLEAPKVTFMLAFLYNNEMMLIDSAKKYYNLFLSLYPSHELAPSAKFELETLGKGPEELLGGGEEPPGRSPGAARGGTPAQ